MEKYMEICIHCGAEIWYSDNDKLIKCTSCGRTLVVAEFVREQQKIEQRLAEGEDAKAELEKAKQEKQLAQEALRETVRALDGIQMDQYAQRETLEKILDEQHADRALQDNMLSLLQSIQAEKHDENGFINHLLQTIGAGQMTADEKLTSINNIIKQLLQNQNNTENMISVFNEHLSVSDQEKKKLIREFAEWQKSIHKEDIERLQSIQGSCNSIQNVLKKLDDEIDRSRTDISKVEDAVKGFESKWETEKRNKLIAKYKLAEKLQKERRFDEAYKYYQDVLINGGLDPEVYWRVFLCYYCIEYQKDDDGKEIPTILYPDLSDPSEVMERTNLLEILDGTDKELREYYYTKLKVIDDILEKYRRWQYKLQYDVFISVKQTVQADGKKLYTRDNKVGRDLYEYLTSLGLKVFNSESVKKPVGEEWEPYILAALMSARVMIVVGTCPEYMESQWVKNEWTRYQWLQKLEKYTNKERLLFCYLSGGMTAEQLPKGLNPGRQAIIDGIGAHIELNNALYSFFPKIKKESFSVDTQEVGQKGELLSEETNDANPQKQYNLMETEKTIEPQKNVFKNSEAIPENVKNKTEISFGQTHTQIKEHGDAFPRIRRLRKVKSTMISIMIIMTMGLGSYVVIRSLGGQPLWPLLSNSIMTPTALITNTPYEKPTIESITITETPISTLSSEQSYTKGKNLIEEGHYSEGIEFLQLAAQMGHRDALYLLGSCYEKGVGIKQDETLAAECYQKAAESGHIDSQMKIAEFFGEGIGVDKDDEQMFKYNLLAADQGNADAQYNVGRCYYIGKGIEQNYVKAVEYYQKAADQGNAKAQNNLGNCYYWGDGVALDYKKAVEYYQKSADQGYAVAQNNLADRYFDGNGVVILYKKAVEYYQKSADQGYDNAQYSLGYCYFHGYGVAKNYEKAIEYYQKSADQGHRVAQYSLGDCYYYGYGVKQNYEKAVVYYIKSADQGYPDAQIIVGDCYFYGYGVAQDYEKAVEYYQRAADQENAIAQNSLGTMYQYGYGIKRDYAEAINWYRKSAMQLNASAQYNLGNMYYNGYGVEQNYTIAIKLFKKSAAQGNAEAQYSLGHMYRNGYGVQKDLDIAAEWYQKAADQGHGGAQSALLALKIKKKQ